MALPAAIVGGAAIAAASNVGGGILSQDFNRYQFNTNLDFQKEFAKNGIRWRVADAIAAGIHPLAALGAQTNSFSPVTVGGGAGEGVAAAGQEINRAIQAGMSLPEKEIVAERIKQERLKTEHMGLQNTISRAQLAQLNAPPLQTGIPLAAMRPGSPNLPGQDPAVSYVPAEVTMMESPGIEAGVGALEGYAVNKDGTAYRVPTQKYQEGISEGSLFTQFKYNVGQVVDYLKGVKSALSPDHPSNREFVETLRKSRPPTSSSSHEFRYNVYRGSFVLRKIGPEGTQLWDHPRLFKTHPKMFKMH